MQMLLQIISGSTFVGQRGLRNMTASALLMVTQQVMPWHSPLTPSAKPRSAHISL
jgi:hypothetical protein